MSIERDMIERMSPAEKLRMTKRRKRPKRNGPAKAETVLWQTTLKEVRERHDLSLRDVAIACRLSVSGYHRIENGFADPQLSSVNRIAVFFDMPVAKLWAKWEGRAA